MMRRWLGPLLVLAASAAAAHALALHLAPGFIMSRAMAALEARGVPLHAFTAPVRVTPQTQQVVRNGTDGMAMPVLTQAVAMATPTAQQANVGLGLGDFANANVPSVWRHGRSGSAAAKVEALSSNGMDEIEIPAFLRKQAD